MKLHLTVLPCTLHTRFPPPSPFPSLSPNAAPSRRRCTAFSSQRKPLLRCHIFCWRQDRAIGGAETSIDVLAVLLLRESPGGGNGAHRACWNMCLSLQGVLWQFRFVGGWRWRWQRESTTTTMRRDIVVYTSERKKSVEKIWYGKPIIRYDETAQSNRK